MFERFEHFNSKKLKNRYGKSSNSDIKTDIPM